MIPSVVKWQIITPQPDVSAAFYKSLFGWSVALDNALGYRTLASGSGRGIDGGVWPAPPQTPSFVQLFIEVPDVEAALSLAQSLGATVLVPRAVLPDGDVMAVLQDPTGVTFGLCTTKPNL